MGSPFGLLDQLPVFDFVPSDHSSTAATENTVFYEVVVSCYALTFGVFDVYGHIVRGYLFEGF